MPRPLTDDEQFTCLCVLDALSDIVTDSEKETYTKTEVLLLIDILRSTPELFDPDVVVAQQMSTEGL